MRVVILGGSGLVGRSLSADWAKDGHAVTIVCRHPEQLSPVQPGVDVLEWDGHTPTGWADRLDGAEAVVNLAGETIGGTNLGQVFFQRWGAGKKQRILESRVNAGRAVVEAIGAARARPRVLLQMSAVGVYGPHGDETLDEKSPAGQDFLAQVCREWERSTEAVEAMGVRRVVVRTGLVLSLEGGLFPVILLPFRLFVGGRLGSGRQGLSWIHAQDHRRALRFLIEDSQAGGIFNVTAPEPVSNTELGRQLARALHRPYWFPTPAVMLKLVLGEKATLVLDGQHVAPRRLLEQGFSFHHPNLSAALADLLRT
jgi:uncharacterized protein (TIGR01777 family)